MSRFASPLVGERSPKRSRKSIEPTDTEKAPEHIVDIVPNGDADALLVVRGLAASQDAPVGIRVSRVITSMASAVLKRLFATTAVEREDEPKIVLALAEEDGDAVLAFCKLCNILHLRHDKLPTRVSAAEVLDIALLAHKYECTVAAGRATTQWFDRLYHANGLSQIELCKVVEAAYLLDEAVYFARFTSRWVLEASIISPQLPVMSMTETRKMAFVLLSRQTAASTQLRTDLDTLVDIAIRCFSREYKHYIDWAPEMSPDPSETPSGKQPVRCRVDGDAAQEFLGALRDAHIMPSGTWSRAGEDDVAIGEIVSRLTHFVLPDYDDVDRCEFCDRIKVHFAKGLEDVKRAQKERLWGLCVDCLKAGGFNEEECRSEHAKGEQADTKAQSPLHIQPQPHASEQALQHLQPMQQQSGGLGIEGL